MGRINTTRTSENNKNTIIQISNRISNEPISTPYGERHQYGELEELECCLMPFKTEVEASLYGITKKDGRKLLLPLGMKDKFNSFTHIWENIQPDVDKLETEYIVKDVSTTLNYVLVVLTKKVGS